WGSCLGRFLSHTIAKSRPDGRHKRRSYPRPGGARCTGRAPTHAPRISLGALHEVQQARLSMRRDPDGSARRGEGRSQIDRVVAARGKLERTNTMMMLAIRRALRP